APARNLTARFTWFDNRVENPVSNVTLTPTLAQKQNLGRTRIWGVQSDVEYLIGKDWRVSGGYLYDQAKVTDGGVANANLVGKYLAQVPVHRGSLQASYNNPKVINLSLGVQFAGLQYNDDQNVQFISPATLAAAGYDTGIKAGLPGYTSVDLLASRDLNSRIQVFFGAQNLLDRAYFVQTNPSTVGTPRMITGGIHVRFSGK
ncbi:MAG: TonB-dependent receptor, partial [Vicinamibacterales bacterium]